MSEFQFNVTGTERKRLVGAISELTNSKITYNGAPTFSYDCGGYHIDKTGLVTGEYNLNLFVGLSERGFEAEISPVSAEESTEPEVIPAVEETAHTAAQGEDTAQAETSDRLTVEIPNDFTPDQMDNLCKMVIAKESLLKKALGAENLPVRVTEEKVCFPWFALSDPSEAAYYVQFIGLLCETAKEKKRVTAKAPESFENEKFCMRIWLISLGAVGKEYGNMRKLLGKNLGGESGWRYGKPEKAAPAAEERPTEVENAGKVADHE